MCQIDFVTSFIWLQYKTAPAYTGFRAFAPGPGTTQQETSCQQASCWASNPVPSCPLHIRVYLLCYSPGRWCLPACPSFLPFLGLHIWAWGRMIHTHKQKQSKQQNPAGSASINYCFPCPQGSWSSFLLTKFLQHLYYSPHLGDGKCEMSWCVQSHRVHH